MGKTFGQKGTAYLGNDFTAEIDSKGKWGGSDTFTAPFNTVQNVLPKIGSICPRQGWNFLTVESAKIDNVHGNLCTITVQYTGSNSNSNTFNYDNAPNDSFTYELAITSSEEPLETHPKYRTSVSIGEKEIIGYVKLGSLVRETEGEYTFKDIHGGESKTIESEDGKELVDFILKGVETYMHARQTWRARYQDKNLPNASRLNKVGKIDNPKGAPSVGGGRNWLYMGCNASQQGKIYTIVNEWELSGAEGWYEEIYK